MRKKIQLFFILIFVCIYNVDINAQVGINTENPDASSILDVVDTTKGILIPRMTTVQKEAIQNPATSLLVYDTSLACFSQYNGSKWKCIDQPDQVRWFYMPSIAIDAEEISTTSTTIDLYNEYKSQFMGSDPTTFKASQNAPSEIPYFPQATDLYYYVTYYSKDVFEIINISETGVLEYKVIGLPTDETYMNVVFVLK